MGSMDPHVAFDQEGSDDDSNSSTDSSDDDDDYGIRHYFWQFRPKKMKVEEEDDFRKNLKVTVETATSLYRHYGAKHGNRIHKDNAHYYFRKIDSDFTITTHISGKFHHMHDQAGICIKADNKLYLTCGIDVHVPSIMSGGFAPSAMPQPSRLGLPRNYVATVVQRGDGADSNEEENRDIVRHIDLKKRHDYWVRVMRRGVRVECYASDDGAQWKLIRVCNYFTDTERLSAGVFGASPASDGFKCRFENFAATDDVSCDQQLKKLAKQRKKLAKKKKEEEERARRKAAEEERRRQELEEQRQQMADDERAKAEEEERQRKEEEERLRKIEEEKERQRKEEEDKQRQLAAEQRRLDEEEQHRKMEEERKKREEEEKKKKEEEKQQLKELQDRLQAEKERALKEAEDAAAERERKKCEEELEALRKRMEERKAAEAKLREKASFATRELIKRLEFESTQRELTPEEKRKLTEYYETRKLMTYQWWHRLNRPMKKDMKRRCKKGSMTNVDLEPEDVELLPWIMDGMFVNVPLVSDWLGSLDPEVIHTCASWM